MRLLLDTATFIWAATAQARISRAALSALHSDAAVREVSVVSLAEIAIKQAAGKLAFGADHVTAAIADLQLRVLPYTAEHSLRLFDLPLHHRDPFDRQLIAQALAENVPIVTPDEKFHLYKGVRIIW